MNRPSLDELRIERRPEQATGKPVRYVLWVLFAAAGLAAHLAGAVADLFVQGINLAASRAECRVLLLLDQACTVSALLEQSPGRGQGGKGAGAGDAAEDRGQADG